MSSHRAILIERQAIFSLGLLFNGTFWFFLCNKFHLFCPVFGKEHLIIDLIKNLLDLSYYLAIVEALPCCLRSSHWN